MGVSRKRRCRICGCWFVPDVRARKQQRVCGRPQCQQERHRRACARWHDNNRGYDRDRRLRAKIVRSPEQIAADPGVQQDPLRAISWLAVRDAVELEHAVVIEETARVLVDWARDAVAAHPLEIRVKTPRQAAPLVRDAIGLRAPPR
jgi:hypothetical protein